MYYEKNNLWFNINHLLHRIFNIYNVPGVCLSQYVFFSISCYCCPSRRILFLHKGVTGKRIKFSA